MVSKATANICMTTPLGEALEVWWMVLVVDTIERSKNNKNSSSGMKRYIGGKDSKGLSGAYFEGNDLSMYSTVVMQASTSTPKT